uniref:Reverse transcriptase domain-containing protein n=1 Tax=Cannabis sativa TaxID=3483 RepID=A0A803PJT8_CANSA
MLSFQNFVNKYSLIPVHFVGNKFTWKHSSTYERLDWVIANDKWLQQYPQAILHHLRFYGSDHRVLKLVLVDDSMSRVKNKRFMFENHWLTDPSFFNTVSNSWCGSVLNSNNCPLSNFLSKQGSSSNATNLLLSAISAKLSAQQFCFLDAPFTADEVKTALFQLSGDKASGLDGMNDYFYQKNWNTLGEDLCMAILDILNNNASMNSINSTLIVLIPKKANASSLKDFRPISLCRTLYKIVAKVIANRIKVVMEDIISLTQSAFLSDRLIFDNIFIAQEMVHAINHRKLGKIGWVGLKLDMEKAFDRVEWNFLLAILKHFNFLERIINLIHKCLSSVSIRFNINGSFSREIFPTRGIRQGDPLSPYLFLLCSEGLSAALCNQQRIGNFHGISIARNAPVISHLLFADDTLLFARATQTSYNAIKAALQMYNQATGQQVNFSKSSILFSPNTPSHVSDYFYSNLGLAHKPFMSKYLGVPQCFGRSKKSSFNFVLDRVSSHLNVWNNKFFSKAGKEVRLKAVIQAIPSYVMSCFKIPASIRKKVEKLMAQFWWGSFGKNTKTHWKSCATVANILQVPIGGINKNDSLIWKGDPSGLLTVKSAYHLVNGKTDAATDTKHSKIGLGAIIKDWTGRIIAGILLPIPALVSPLMAEAMALKSALDWCCSIRIPLASIFTDSKQLISKINSSKKELSALPNIVEDIKSSSSYFPTSSICFVPRDSNTYAHHMAQNALGLEEELVWKDFYPNLSVVT